MEETEQRGRASGRVAVKRLEHVAIVVDDLAAAMAFFAELGLDLEGEATLESNTVDRLSGLDGVRSDIATMRIPGGHGRLELIKYHTPPGRALLRPWPRGDHHRAGRADQLTVGERPSAGTGLPPAKPFTNACTIAVTVDGLVLSVRVSPGAPC